MIHQKQKGFTLIELLVVIAIIGTLSGVVLVSLQGARAKARDAVRKSDIRQVVTAMQLYYAKYEEFYIYDGGGEDEKGIPDIGGFLPSVDDPQASSENRHYVLEANNAPLTCDAAYLYRRAGQWFCVYAEMESPDPKCAEGETSYIAGSQYGTRTVCGNPPSTSGECTCFHSSGG